MRKKWNKIVTVSGVVWLLCMTATACSPTSTADEGRESIAADTQIPDNDEADGSQAAELPDADTVKDSTDGSDLQTDKDGTDSSDLQTDKDGTANEADIDDQNGRWHVLDPETAKRIDADFEGKIQKLGQGSFYISESVTEILDDDAMVFSEPATGVTVPDSDLLQVVYDNNTRFYIRMIYDNGASYEDSEAGSDDLEQNDSVALKGSIQNDIFYADEVRISRVQ